MVFSADTRLSALALIISVVPAQRGAAAEQHQVADHLARIGARGHPESDRDPGKRQRKPDPLRRPEMIAGKEPARAEHDQRTAPYRETERRGSPW